MRCPFCLHPDSRVMDSREAEDGAVIRRRRSCPACSRRFTTLETAALVVRKRSGVPEPFSRAKVLAGVRKACQGRPVAEDDLAVLGHAVEEQVRAEGAAQVSSQDVGRAVLAPLRRLDEVAYLRFASVYRSFETLGDFEREIAQLRAAGRTGDPDEPSAASSAACSGVSRPSSPSLGGAAGTPGAGGGIRPPASAGDQPARPNHLQPVAASAVRKAESE